MPIKEILGGISQWAENGMKSGYKVSFALLWEDSSGCFYNCRCSNNNFNYQANRHKHLKHARNTGLIVSFEQYFRQVPDQDYSFRYL